MNIAFLDDMLQASGFAREKMKVVIWRDLEGIESLRSKSVASATRGPTLT
jgi:hypothetical protein